MKKVYLQRMKHQKYDDGRHILYLNEEVIEGYVPESVPEGEEAKPCTAYSYEGPELDGGTLINADKANYDDFVAGLVRLKYSQNQVEAILLNYGDGSEEHLAEYNELQLYRKECKLIASEVLARES